MRTDPARCLNLKKRAIKKLRTSIAADGTHLDSGGTPKRRAAESKTKMGRAAARKAKKVKLEDAELERKLVNLIEETGHCVRSVSASLECLADVSENRHAQQSEDRKIALLEKMIAFCKRQGHHDSVDDLVMQYEGLLDASVAGIPTSVATKLPQSRRAPSKRPT